MMRDKEKEREEGQNPSVDENKKLQDELDRSLIYTASTEIIEEEEEPEEDNDLGFDLPGPSSGAKEHSSAVIAAYLRLGKALPLIKRKDKKDDDEPGHMLSFNSVDEAHQFFSGLAHKDVKFLYFEADSRGGLTGQYFMSVGDGQYRTGTVSRDQLPEMRNHFEKFMSTDDKKSQAEALAGINEITNPTPKSTVTPQWGNVNPKTSNTVQKQAAPTDSAPQPRAEENTQDVENKKSTAPTPFKRTPTP
jgi:hypothetical protein